MSSLASQRLAILGCGNLGRALLAGLVESGALPREHVSVTTRRPERAAELERVYGVSAGTDNLACVAEADIVLLAVKPQKLPKLLKELAPQAAGKLWVSVAAGVRIGTLEDGLGEDARVIRSMPNTPAVIKESATALSLGTHATEADHALATTIFSAVGRVVTVEETQLDAVTGLSGSGPAYVFLMIEAFADAGVKVGLSRDVAMELAVQTILGSAKMLQETNEHPGKLKDQVTSPGGCAIAGLHTLEAGGLRTTIMNAVEAATLRATQLGSD